MFRALRAWTLQVDEFEDIHAYFDLRRNQNWSLNRSATMRAILAGLAKVFHPEIFKWYYKMVYGENHLISRIWKAAADDPEINVMVLLGCTIRHDFVNDPDNIIEYDDEDNPVYDEAPEPAIVFELDYPTAIQPDYIYYSYAGTELPLEQNSDDEVIRKSLEFLREYSRHINSLDETSLSRLMPSVHSLVNIKNPLFGLMFNHQFGRNQYYMTVKYDDGSFGETRSNNMISTFDRITSLHRFEVADLFSHAPRLMCYELISGTDRTRFYRILNYSTNIAALMPGALRQDNELSSNLYGIELEVSSNVEPQAVVEATEKLYCACKSDVSISGSKAHKYEIVSKPCTIKAHKKAWGEILEKVGYDAFDVTRSTNNGMHVHVDLNAFRNKDGQQDGHHQRAFAWFFTNPLNRAFMELISERDANSFAQYSGSPNFPTHLHLSHLYKNLLGYMVRPYRGIVAFKQNHNTGQNVTLEVRLFKGIVSLASIWKNLEFVDSIFHFTTKAPFQHNNLTSYLHYLQAQPRNRYVTLREFLNRLDLDPVIETNRISHMVYGQSDAEKIKHIVNNNFSHLTGSQVEIINSLVKEAKFSLGKDGKLAIVISNRSRVHDLDNVLHQKLGRSRKGTVNNVPHTRP